MNLLRPGTRLRQQAVRARSLSSVVATPGAPAGAYYRLNGDLTDSSGNGLDLTPDTAAPTYAAAVLGNGLATDGSLKKVGESPGNTLWQPGTLLDTSLSISAWLYGQAGTSFSVTREGAKVGWDQCRLVYVARSSSQHGVKFNLSGKIDGTGRLAAVTAGAWNHVVATWDHTTATRDVWVNGTKTYTESAVVVNGNAFVEFIVNATTDFASGCDEAGFWTRKLTDDEIASLYNAGTGYDPTA